MSSIGDTHQGGIVRVDYGAGRWGAIPQALADDRRISLEALGVATWMCTRPPGWHIIVAALRRQLGIGRDRWRRIATELEAAGYLSRRRLPGPGGRIAWEIIFRPVPEPGAGGSGSMDGLSGHGERTMAGLAVDGRAVDGSPGHIYTYTDTDIPDTYHTHPAPDGAGTHSAKPSGVGDVSSSAADAGMPAQAREQARQILGEWTPGRRRAGWRILGAMRRLDGAPMTAADWDSLLAAMGRADDQPAWLRRVAATGWDPRGMAYAARPGETAAQARQRLREQRVLVQDDAGAGNDLQQQVQQLVADILSRRGAMRAMPPAMDWTAVCADQLARLAELAPDHRLVAEAEDAALRS